MTGQASSSSSFSYQWTYDVFLNFRGEDTRNGFVGNLFNALRQKGIRPFMDDGELRKMDEITPSLFKAIEESRMAITVFSKNYASSTFCLDELVKILQCIKGNSRLVWPIFYDVKPSDVRHQKGNYEQALALHQENLKASEHKLQIWKQALREAANISGLHFNPAGLPSLRDLNLGQCISLEKFPEVLEKMEHIIELCLNGTKLELPHSIVNLTGLQELKMMFCQKKAPLPEVEGTYIEGCEELRSANQDKVKEELCSMQYSKATYIDLHQGNISNELLSMYLTWFTNVKNLNLSFNDFTILPACIEDCYNLSYLNLDNCKHLSEIRGIPPNIMRFQARNCTSLSSESKSMLLSQKLHENGYRTFVVPGASIPEWFDHFSCGASISFWFCFRENDYLTISLCVVVTPPVDTNPALEKIWYHQELFAKLIVNGTDIHEHFWVENLTPLSPMFADHIVVALSLFNSLAWNDVLLNYEYNHVEVHMYVETRDTKDKLISVKEIGINVMKEGNRRDDIHFINPYEGRKLNDLNWDSSFGVPTGCKGLLNPLLCSHISHLIDRDTEKWKEDNLVGAILRKGMNDSENQPFLLFLHYEKLWKLQLPVKIKIFLWKAHRNRLEVKENLAAIGINVDDHTCPNCGAVGESVIHTLVACPFAEVIWSMSPLMLRSRSLPQASFSSWWEDLSSSVSYFQDSTGMLEIAGFICWRIWKCRNEKVFNRGSTGARQVISLVIKQVNEFQRLLRNG